MPEVRFLPPDYLRPRTGHYPPNASRVCPFGAKGAPAAGWFGFHANEGGGPWASAGACARAAKQPGCGQRCTTGQVRVRLTPPTAWTLATMSLPSPSMSAASARTMTS